VANDYKKDEAKAPLLAALQPFVPALYALARMMDDMQHKHRLAGSTDPFNQWAQLPEAKARMAQALERHLLPEEGTLWDVNAKDGTHLHATHGLFNLLGSLTLHLRELAAAKPQDAMRDAVAAPYVWCRCGHQARIHMERCQSAGCVCLQFASVGGTWWTGEGGSWHCTCGAGRPMACTCPKPDGEA
jgi:hypothetical protein